MTREEREELIKHLKYNRSIGADYLITDKDADEIIKALEQEPILDKIRAEIAQKQYDFMANTDYDEGVRFGLMLAYQILDKYKESEE